MRSLICLVVTLLALAACDNTKEQGQQTVRQLSGSQMIEQKQAMKQQLEEAQKQQSERFKQTDQ